MLDSFYVDAEVSADGHNWSMATRWAKISEGFNFAEVDLNDYNLFNEVL